MERLKGQTILIGKEPGQGRLLVSLNNKAAVVGPIGSVPNCVSRCLPQEGVAHAKITVDQSGNMVLTNMKPQNVTYVNGSEILSKRITASNSIELGKDRFTVNLPVIIETAKKMVSVVPTPPDRVGLTPERPKSIFNISHLNGAWERYQQELDRIAKEKQEAQRKRLLPIMIGSLSGIASPILATITTYALFFTVPLAVISFSQYLIFYRSKDTSHEDQKIAAEKFSEEYICPNPDCGKFLGKYSYKLLKKQYSMKCPYCKCNYVEK